MFRNIVTSLDVGSSKVATVVAEKNSKEGNLRILGVGISPARGIRRGTVVDMEDAVSSIRASVAEARRASGVAIKSVWLGVGGGGVSVSSSKGVVAVARADREISEDDVARSTAAAESFIPKNPNKELIHILPKDYKVDGEAGIKDPIGMFGVRLEVDALIVECSSLILKNLLKCVENVGLRADNLVFGPLAAAEAVLTKRQKELGVMLLDIGGGTSSFIVFEEGSPAHAGVIPWGGGHITNDIAIGFKTHVDVAETVKCSLGHCLPGEVSKKEQVRLADFIPEELTRRTFETGRSAGDEKIWGTYPKRELAEIIEARLRDVSDTVQKELKKIAKDQLLPAGVILVGGSSLIPGLTEFVKREIKLPAEQGIPYEFAESFEAEALPFFTTSLGILKLAFKEEPAKGLQWKGLGKISQGAVSRWFRSLLP